jgi:hypothetical protein
MGEVGNYQIYPGGGGGGEEDMISSSRLGRVFRVRGAGLILG